MGALDDLMSYGQQFLDRRYDKIMAENEKTTPRTIAGDMLATGLSVLPARSLGMRQNGRISVTDDVLAGRNNEPVKRFAVEQDGMKGRLSVTPEGTVRNSFLNPGLRGQGLGRSMYETASDYFGDRGMPLRSDVGVSGDAARIYDSLQRRGYPVSRNPSAQPTPDGGWATGTQDPVFTINPQGQLSGPLGALMLGRDYRQ